MSLSPNHAPRTGQRVYCFSTGFKHSAGDPRRLHMLVVADDYGSARARLQKDCHIWHRDCFFEWAHVIPAHHHCRLRATPMRGWTQ